MSGRAKPPPRPAKLSSGRRRLGNRLLIAALSGFALIVLIAPLGVMQTLGLSVPGIIAEQGAALLAGADVLLALAAFVVSAPFRRGVSARAVAITLLLLSAAAMSLYVLDRVWLR